MKNPCIHKDLYQWTPWWDSLLTHRTFRQWSVLPGLGLYIPLPTRGQHLTGVKIWKGNWKRVGWYWFGYWYCQPDLIMEYQLHLWPNVHCSKFWVIFSLQPFQVITDSIWNFTCFFFLFQQFRKIQHQSSTAYLLYTDELTTCSTGLFNVKYYRLIC